MVIFVACVLSTHAQKNTFYISGGTAVTAFSASVNYERTISQAKSVEGGNTFRIKLSGGLIRLNGLFDERFTGGYTAVSGAVLIGKFGKFVELNFGGTFVVGRGDSGDAFGLVPTASIGYRREFHNRLFRVGASFPEWLYLGYGTRF